MMVMGMGMGMGTGTGWDLEPGSGSDSDSDSGVSVSSSGSDECLNAGVHCAVLCAPAAHRLTQRGWRVGWMGWLCFAGRYCALLPLID